MTRIIDVSTLILIVLAALVFGGVGFFNFNIIGYLFNDKAYLIYCVFGISGIWQAARQRLT